MIKHIRSFVLLALGALILLGLTACKKEQEELPYEPESASALWAKVDETMNALNSFEMTGDIHVMLYSMGYKFAMDGTTSSVYTADSVYNEIEMEGGFAEISESQTSNVIEAYHDGKMYLATSNGTYTQRFCSSMTLEEYEDFQTNDLVVSIDIEDCTSAEFSKEEEGTWILEFSGYTKKTIDQMLESMNPMKELLGDSIEDMKVSLSADAQFRVKEMTVALVFTGSEDMGEESQEFTITYRYSGFDETQFDASRLNAGEFTEIPDVRILERLTDALRKRQESIADEFTLDLSTTYEYQGRTDTVWEKDVVSYGKKNGAYYYSIDAVMEGDALIIKYQNGTQTVEMGGQTQTAVQSEEEAETFINGLINSARYNSIAITGVEKEGEGVYTLISDNLDLSEYAPAVEGNGIELTSANQQITVTFSEEKLMQINSKITLNGVYAGESMTMVIDSVVAFDNRADTTKM